MLLCLPQPNQKHQYVYSMLRGCFLLVYLLIWVKSQSWPFPFTGGFVWVFWWSCLFNNWSQNITVFRIVLAESKNWVPFTEAVRISNFYKEIEYDPKGGNALDTRSGLFGGNYFLSKIVPQKTTESPWENQKSIKSSTLSAKEDLHWVRLSKFLPVCGE